MAPSIEEYILSHSDPEPHLLKEMYRDAQVNLLHGRMVSGHLQGRLLKMITQMIRPKQVLELGAFTGYSAICIAEGLENEGATIHTVEIDDEMEGFIEKYLSRFAGRDKIKVYFDDALNIIPTFDNDFFDLVFIDADKRLYWQYFELVLPKIRRGGFILADNTLWDGKVLEKVNSADWQTIGIVEFNDKLARDNRVEKVILPVRDGLTLIRKK